MSAPRAHGQDRWLQQYADLLAAHIERPSDESLECADELGCRLSRSGVPLGDLVAAHLAAWRECAGLGASPQPVEDAAAFLARVMTAYDSAFQERLSVATDAERRFREIADNSRDVIYRLRLSDRAMEYVSPSCEELTGFRPEELVVLGRDGIFGLVHPDDRPRIPAVPPDNPGEGAATPVEFRIRHRNGQYRWCSAARALIRDEAGAPLAVIGIVRNITAQREHLEQMVAGRTRELARLNELLQQELRDRERVEQALRESEERFRQLAENVREAFWLYDPRTGKALYANPACEQMWGEPVESIYAHADGWQTAIHPDDRPGVLADVRKQEAACPTEHEYRAVRPDGTIRWLRSRAFPIRDAAGEVCRIAGLTEDITDRKQAENLLHIQRDLGIALSSTTTLAEAVDHVLEAALRIGGIDCGGVYVIDPVSGGMDLIAFKNLTAEFVSGASHFSADSLREDLISKGLPLYWRKPDIPVIKELVRREGMRAVAVIPVRFEERLVASLHLGSHSQDEIPVYARQALEDIACRIGSVIAHVRTEAALHDSEELFRTIISASKDAMVALGRDGLVTIFNPAAEELFGWTREEMIGQRLDRLMPAEYRQPHRQYVEGYFATGLPSGGIGKTAELSAVRKDGTTVPIELSLSAGRAGSTPFVVAVIRDVTERKRAEEAARQHQEQLAHVSRVSTVGEMASGLAHELAQPLSAILYYARGCSTRLRAGAWGAADAADALQKIAAQAERAGEFIRRLKAFVRKAQPSRAPADINAIVRESLSFAAGEAREKKVVVRLELSDGLPSVIVDTIQIEQVILNLVRNAFEAMSQTSPEERELLIRTYTCPGHMVCVGVKDTGPGLTPEGAQQAFDPFFTTKANGTGLGLSISRSIIEAHEGTLHIEPNVVGGTRFVMSLPPVEGTGHDGK